LSHLKLKPFNKYFLFNYLQNLIFNSIKKQLAEIYPKMKDDELELMAKINTKKDVDAYLKASGQDIKK
jgi:hypothetical protein